MVRMRWLADFNNKQGYTGQEEEVVVFCEWALNPENSTQTGSCVVVAALRTHLSN